MRHEYVCGAVLYTVTPSGIRYVLVIEKEGHCGLPKGHIEPGETETQTALREIREETGITARIIDGFCLEVSYQKRSCLQKHLTCFLAAYDNQYTPSHTSAVQDVLLLPYVEAYAALSYPTSKELLEKAHQFLLNNGI